MKYRLKSDPSVTCIGTEFPGCRPSISWMNVHVVDDAQGGGFAFSFPRWLFDKEWEPVPQYEPKDPRDPVLYQSCEKCNRLFRDTQHPDEVDRDSVVRSFEDVDLCMACVSAKKKVVKPRCSACMFWEEAKGTTPSKGLCHCNSPMPRTDGQLCGVPCWPVTHSDDWCSDFEAKE